VQAYGEGERFHYYTVRGAGHMVPHDRPLEAQELFRRFITNNHFN